MNEFLITNWALVALFITSGAMMFLPDILRATGVGAKEVGAAEATRLMNDNALVLDVRNPAEFSAGHLARAKHIPLSDLPKRLADLDRHKTGKVIVVCESGLRSRSAAKLLTRSGFTQVVCLRGGQAEWQKSGLPLEK